MNGNTAHLSYRSPPSYDDARSGRRPGPRAALINGALSGRYPDHSPCRGQLCPPIPAQRIVQPSARDALAPRLRRLHRSNVVSIRVASKSS